MQKIRSLTRKNPVEPGRPRSYNQKKMKGILVSEMREKTNWNDEYWQAVAERDARYDGRFVFAVQSTGIYCRPSCPSRRPDAARVSFFPGPAEAEAAGFRACKRCRPNGPAGNPAHVELARQVSAYLDAHRDEPVTLAGLAAEFHTSPYHLQRIFKRTTGISPRQYHQALRSGDLKAELRQAATITGAIYQAGYGSSSGFYQNGAARIGMSPRAYRQGGQSMTIHYTITGSPLGRLLVAITGKGVCAVSLGESDTALEDELAREFPAARRERSDDALQPALTAVLAYLAGTQQQIDLPLDVQATAFQERVWQQLRAIPFGETRTYAQIAAQLGMPTGARAVARACASNPAAFIIPCHRVIGSGGDLRGYRWGLDRKRRLLEQEKSLAGSEGKSRG